MGFKWTYGVNMEQAIYYNKTFNVQPFENYRFHLQIEFFSNLEPSGKSAKKLIRDRLVLSLGARMDGNTYSDQMANPFNQFSPRFFSLFLPHATTHSELQYRYFFTNYLPTQSWDIADLTESSPIQTSPIFRINIWFAGFCIHDRVQYPLFLWKATTKLYDNYPFLTRDSVSLANLGGDFGVIGKRACGIDVFWTHLWD